MPLLALWNARHRLLFIFLLVLTLKAFFLCLNIKCIVLACLTLICESIPKRRLYWTALTYIFLTVDYGFALRTLLTQLVDLIPMRLIFRAHTHTRSSLIARLYGRKTLTLVCAYIK